MLRTTCLHASASTCMHKYVCPCISVLPCYYYLVLNLDMWHHTLHLKSHACAPACASAFTFTHICAQVYCMYVHHITQMQWDHNSTSTCTLTHVRKCTNTHTLTNTSKQSHALTDTHHTTYNIQHTHNRTCWQGPQALPAHTELAARRLVLHPSQCGGAQRTRC